MFDTFGRVRVSIVYWVFLFLSCCVVFFSVGYALAPAMVNLGIIILFASALCVFTLRLSFSLAVVFFIYCVIAKMIFVKRVFLDSSIQYSDLQFVINIFSLGAEDMIAAYFSSPMDGLKSIATTLTVLVVAVWAFIHSEKIKFGSFIHAQFIMSTIFFGYLIYTTGYAELIEFANNRYNTECHYEAKSKRLDACYTNGAFVDAIIAYNNVKLKPKNVQENADLAIDLAKKEYDRSAHKYTKKLPHVVTILNESTFDPSYLDLDVDQSMLEYSMFDDEYIRSHGLLKVHTFGGLSSRSEFPAATGVLHDLFDGKTTYPFLDLAHRMHNSLLNEMKKAGYYIVVIYPVKKHFFGADVGYMALGADRIVDIDDYNFTPKGTWREVPNSVIAKMITNEIAIAPDNKPVFVIASTMLNHGPHDSNAADDIGCSALINTEACGKLNDYMHRLESSSDDFDNFFSHIMSLPDPVVIVNFGDHLPSFEGYMIDSIKFDHGTDAVEQYYLTFYNIRANFKLNKSYSYQIMDISYIPSVILDIIGRNNNTLYEAASVIRDKCDGLLYECKSIDMRLLDSYKKLMLSSVDLSVQDE